MSKIIEADITKGARFKLAEGDVFIIDEIETHPKHGKLARTSKEGGPKGNYRDLMSELVDFLNEEGAVKVFAKGGGMSQTFKDLDAAVTISLLDKNDLFYKDGYRYEARIGFPESLGEMGNYSDNNVYKDLPSREEIRADVIDTIKAELQELEENGTSSAREENILAALKKIPSEKLKSKEPESDSIAILRNELSDITPSLEFLTGKDKKVVQEKIATLEDAIKMLEVEVGGSDKSKAPKVEGEEQQKFINALFKMFPEGVKLYHRTDTKNVESILKKGIKGSDAEEDENAGVYTILGDPNSDRIGGLPGSTTLFEISVPVKDYKKLFPEVGTYNDKNCDDDPDMLFANYMEVEKGLIGGDIIYYGNVPKAYISIYTEAAAKPVKEEPAPFIPTLDKKNVDSIINRFLAISGRQYYHGTYDDYELEYGIQLEFGKFGYGVSSSEQGPNLNALSKACKQFNEENIGAYVAIATWGDKYNSVDLMDMQQLSKKIEADTAIDVYLRISDAPYAKKATEIIERYIKKEKHENGGEVTKRIPRNFDKADWAAGKRIAENDVAEIKKAMDFWLAEFKNSMPEAEWFLFENNDCYGGDANFGYEIYFKPKGSRSLEKRFLSISTWYQTDRRFDYANERQVKNERPKSGVNFTAQVYYYEGGNGPANRITSNVMFTKQEIEKLLVDWKKKLLNAKTFVPGGFEKGGGVTDEFPYGKVKVGDTIEKVGGNYKYKITEIYDGFEGWNSPVKYAKLQRLKENGQPVKEKPVLEVVWRETKFEKGGKFPLLKKQDEYIQKRGHFFRHGVKEITIHPPTDAEIIEKLKNKVGKYMGNKGDQVVIESAGKEPFLSYYLVNAENFAMVDMFFSSDGAARAYAEKTGMKVVPNFIEKKRVGGNFIQNARIVTRPTGQLHAVAGGEDDEMLYSEDEVPVCSVCGDDLKEGEVDECAWCKLHKNDKRDGGEVSSKLEHTDWEKLFAHPERFMRYDGQFLYPPRIEFKLQPSSLDKLDNGQYIGQLKVNGSNTSVTISENKVVAKERHNTFFAIPPKFDFQSMHRGKGYMAFAGEYMNKSKKGPDGKPFRGFIIWDIMAFENKILIGSTVEERAALIDFLYPTTGAITVGGYEILHKTATPDVYKITDFEGNFRAVYDELVKVDFIEGFVLKRKNGVLGSMNKEANNTGFSVKIRKPTNNYKF